MPPHASKIGRAALVVIDLQVGVLGTCVNSDQVLATVSKLLCRARSAGVPVVWVVHEDNVLPRGSFQGQLADGLTPREEELVVYKRFRDAFAATPLETLLRERGIGHLMLVGAQTEYCVRTTAQSAVLRGFDITLVEDGHTTSDSEWEGISMATNQIITHTNQYFAGLSYPGRRVFVAPAHQLEL